MIRNSRFQNRITAGRFTLPIAILLSVACWILSGILLPEAPIEKNDYGLWKTVQLSMIPVWSNRVLSFAFYSLMGYILIELNNVFAIIRMRASVQTTIYILLISVCPALHSLQESDMASMMYVLALFLLFKSYQQTNSSGAVFHSFLFIGTGSLFFPQLTLLTPIFLVGAYNFQSLTLKSFFAAVIGWISPYGLLLGYAFLAKDMSLFYQPFNELASFQPICVDGSFLLWETVTFGYLFVLFAVSAVHCFIAAYEDRMRSRAYLHFLILLNLVIFAYLILQPSCSIQLLPLVLVNTSILGGHLFALTNSRASNIFFICVLIGLILLSQVNIWTLL